MTLRREHGHFCFVTLNKIIKIFYKKYIYIPDPRFFSPDSDLLKITWSAPIPDDVIGSGHLYRPCVVKLVKMSLLRSPFEHLTTFVRSLFHSVCPKCPSLYVVPEYMWSTVRPSVAHPLTKISPRWYHPVCDSDHPRSAADVGNATGRR